MTTLDQQLNDKRALIDGFDTQLIDLLRKRTEVVQAVAALKQLQKSDVYIRPAREAEVVRRLLSEPLGAVQPLAVFNLWREIMMASLQLEAPFRVAVTVPVGDEDSKLAFWDLARQHFGHSTPLIACESAQQAMRLVSEQKALLAVVPDFLDEDEKRANWWHLLLANNDQPLRFVFQLPFVAFDKPRVSAFVLGRVPPVASGQDSTFILIAVEGDLSRSTLRTQLKDVGIEPEEVVATNDSDNGYYHFLVRAAGFIEKNDEEVAELVEKIGFNVRHILFLGSVATPIILSDNAIA